MNRTFSERKPKKFDAKNKENETIIRALYMYGRVPEQWELLNEIERLNNIIDKLEIDIEFGTGNYTYDTDYNRGLKDAFIYMNDRLQELKGSDSNE